MIQGTKHARTRENGQCINDNQLHIVHSLDGQQGRESAHITPPRENHKEDQRNHQVREDNQTSRKISGGEYLEEANRVRDLNIIRLKVERRFDPLRSDPRFDGLVRSVGIP